MWTTLLATISLVGATGPAQAPAAQKCARTKSKTLFQNKTLRVLQYPSKRLTLFGACLFSNGRVVEMVSIVKDEDVVLDFKVAGKFVAVMEFSTGTETDSHVIKVYDLATRRLVYSAGPAATEATDQDQGSFRDWDLLADGTIAFVALWDGDLEVTDHLVGVSPTGRATLLDSAAKGAGGLLSFALSKDRWVYWRKAGTAKAAQITNG